MGVVFGVNENLVEMTRPRVIQNGVKLHLKVYIRLFAFSVETTPFKNITQTRLKLASMVEFEHFYEQNSFKNLQNSVQTRPC